MQLMHAGDRVGILPTDDFASTSAESRFMTGNGTWLAAPSAVLMGTDGNTTHAVLLSLGNPTYEALSKVSDSNRIEHCAVHGVCRRVQLSLMHGFRVTATSRVQRLL